MSFFTLVFQNCMNSIPLRNNKEVNVNGVLCCFGLKKFENEGDKILGLIIIVLLIETSHLLKLK